VGLGEYTKESQCVRVFKHYNCRFAGIFFVPSARIWGKRHLFLLGTVLLVVSSAWGGAARTYRSLLWARIVQGVSVCPFEALVNAAVGNIPETALSSGVLAAYSLSDFS